MILQPLLLRLDDGKEIIIQNLWKRILDQKHKLSLSLKDLELNNPLAILAKGYALVKDGKTKTIIKQKEDAYLNQDLEITLSFGKIGAKVGQITENPDKSLNPQGDDNK